MKIYDNVTKLIGNTPLVRLNRLTAGLPGQVEHGVLAARRVADGDGVADVAVDEAQAARRQGALHQGQPATGRGRRGLEEHLAAARLVARPFASLEDHELRHAPPPPDSTRLHLARPTDYRGGAPRSPNRAAASSTSSWDRTPRQK